MALPEALTTALALVDQDATALAAAYSARDERTIAVAAVRQQALDLNNSATAEEASIAIDTKAAQDKYNADRALAVAAFYEAYPAVPVS